MLFGRGVENSSAVSLFLKKFFFGGGEWPRVFFWGESPLKWPPGSPACDLFTELNWMPSEDQIIFRQAVQVYA